MDFEITVKVQSPDPDLRICVFLPSREKQNDQNGVVIHYVRGFLGIWYDQAEFTILRSMVAAGVCELLPKPFSGNYFADRLIP